MADIFDAVGYGLLILLFFGIPILFLAYGVVAFLRGDRGQPSDVSTDETPEIDHQEDSRFNELDRHDRAA